MHSSSVGFHKCAITQCLVFSEGCIICFSQSETLLGEMPSFCAFYVSCQVGHFIWMYRTSKRNSPEQTLLFILGRLFQMGVNKLLVPLIKAILPRLYLLELQGKFCKILSISLVCVTGSHFN